MAETQHGMPSSPGAAGSPQLMSFTNDSDDTSPLLPPLPFSPTGLPSSPAAAASSASLDAAAVPASSSTGPVDRAPVKVLWISVDPRSGVVSLYPVAVADRIESNFASRSRNAPLAGLGGVFENVVIEFDTSGHHSQRTSNGKRDVRRVEAAADAQYVDVNIVRERGWRIADFLSPGVTEGRRVDCSAVVAQGGPRGGTPTASPSSAAPAVSAQDVAARRDAARDSATRGLAGLWEWCRIPEPPDPKVVPDSQWGVYSQEQNAALEAGFQEGLPSVTLELGIRTYDIMFDSPTHGRQVDRTLRKRRHVRRRLVQPTDRDCALASTPTNATVAGDEEDCAICFTSFAETASMPTVHLPGCGHVFHGACAQQLADKNSQCPMCRADVDWRAAFGPTTRFRGSM